MTLLQIWVATPAAKALGWTLFYSLGEGAIVALALGAVLWAARPSRARYAAACLAMVSMLAGFGLTFALLLAQQRMQGVAMANIAIPLPQMGMAGWARGTQRASALTAANILPWLAPFWIAGVLTFQLRSLAGWMAARRLCRTGVCRAPNSWQERLDRFGTHLQLSRPVLLLESSLARVPAVVGYLRPTILMPVGLITGLPSGQIEAILLHELAHIRRSDYLVNLLQTFVEGLLFYHPAVWWFSAVIRAEREHCCDDLVVATHGDAHEYASALVALEHSRSAVPATAAAATGGSLVRRIRRLLAPAERPRAGWTPVFSALIVTITAALALTAWQSKAQQPEVVPKSTPWTRWLNEDVTYIVNDAERKAFKSLQTDEEREHFIEQFWQRRDPTPGTVENEFKQEHYRRIAYVNERYGTADFPGWKTDRGRIYIVYGPPDEIETHPAGGSYVRPPGQGGGVTSTYPFEQWLYSHINGVGDNVIVEFVDPNGTGEYRMVSDPNVKETTGGPQTNIRGAGATVVVTGDTTARVSIPLELYGGHPIWVYGRLVTGERRVSGFIQDYIRPALTGERVYTLQVKPGSYQLYVAVRDLTTNTLYTDDIPFQVK